MRRVVCGVPCVWRAVWAVYVCFEVARGVGGGQCVWRCGFLAADRKVKKVATAHLKYLRRRRRQPRNKHSLARVKVLSSARKRACVGHAITHHECGVARGTVMASGKVMANHIHNRFCQRQLPM